MRTSFGTQAISNSCMPRKVNYSDRPDEPIAHKNITTDGQRNKFYKTRLCPYHFKKGSACKGGDNCSYAHSFQELRPSVDLTKTKVCHEYLYGSCKRNADECPFAHGDNDHRHLLFRTTETSRAHHHNNAFDMPLKNWKPFPHITDSDFWPRDAGPFVNPNGETIPMLRSAFSSETPSNHASFPVRAKTFDCSNRSGHISDARYQEVGSPSDPAYAMDKTNLLSKAAIMESSGFGRRQFSGCSSCTTSFGPMQPGLSIETTISGNDDIITRAGIYDDTVSNSTMDKTTADQNTSADDDSKQRLFTSLREVMTEGATRNSLSHKDAVPEIIIPSSKPDELSHSKVTDFCHVGRTDLSSLSGGETRVEAEEDSPPVIMNVEKSSYKFGIEEHINGRENSGFSREMRSSLNECLSYNGTTRSSPHIGRDDEMFLNRIPCGELEVRFELTMSQLVEIISIARNTMNLTDLVSGISRHLTRKL